MKSKGGIDLHVHSTASDGIFHPAELVQMALDRGLSVLSITDHDTVSGVGVALDAASDTDLDIIPGIEISALIASREVHLLGYFIDPGYSKLQEALEVFRVSRRERAQKIVEKLNTLGMNISLQHISQSRQHDEVIGRPHIAQALVSEGMVASMNEAFERYLGVGAPAYVARYRMSYAEALALIRQAGGLPVLAHPLKVTEFVPPLVEAGLAGLEVFYTGYSPGETSELRSLAHRYDLATTGGTDFHGYDRNSTVSVGSVYVPPNTVDQLRAHLNNLN